MELQTFNNTGNVKVGDIFYWKGFESTKGAVRRFGFETKHGKCEGLEVVWDDKGCNPTTITDYSLAYELTREAIHKTIN